MLCIPSVQTDKGMGVKLNFLFAVLSVCVCVCVCVCLFGAEGIAYFE